ncbi:TonB-dependent receptor [Hephaestia mangrovi]|uniref:TonB-dependent receptor n=1 Tax=Hephaestia mangrovi TaxID=2873268 RepID=UPI001CA6BB00|nr:TonB-dependent receptor [Hephaestia mangrovi]MBY8829396.1 TonB-dependent receptor [Hephaestia mangrovi]
MTHLKTALSLGVAIGALGTATAATAQQAPAAGAPMQTQQQETDADSQSDIVVTASKRSDIANRVPISLTAVTQRSLDEQGVTDIGDLARTVPALTLTSSGADMTPNITIRGIYSAAGSPTTGIYLDDVALQKRNALSYSGNGSPIPQLFDLERVEVLRGPQGTLYGGSSEGGTVRLITPAPGLYNYSGYGRFGMSFTKDGDPSAEAGIAVGGPIIKGKLGFRASAYITTIGGYIDHVDVWDSSKKYKSNANSGKQGQFHLALKGQLTDSLSITPSFYYSYDHSDDVDTYWAKVDQSTTTAYTKGSFTYPSHTYGPYDQFGLYKSGDPYLSPRTSKLYVPSVIVDYDFGWGSVKSISSYVHDTTNGVVDEAGFSGEARNLQGGIGFVAELPDFRRQFYFGNRRNAYSEELRLTLGDADSLFSFTGGAYYSHSTIRTLSRIYEDLDALSEVLRGTDTQGVYGAPLMEGNLAQYRSQKLTDKEIAGFGELYIKPTERLKLTAGLRVSRTTFEYDQTLYGALARFAVPTEENGGLTSGKQKNTPITPKFGVSYQLTPDDLLYINAAKGFRAGGVNPTISQNSCAAGLAALGGDAPTTYNPDSVWSYEAGAKLGLLGGLAHIQASAFYIDWDRPQLFQTFPGCSAQFITNAGHAVSRGGDLQVQLRPAAGLTLTGAASYTDAHFTETVLGPTPLPGSTQAVYANKGDTMPIAPWNVSVSARYEMPIDDHWKIYLRGDYQYASAYKETNGPGTVSYAPEKYWADATHYASLRLGAMTGPIDLALYVQNLFDSTDTLSKITGGRGTCRNTECTSYAIDEPQYIYQTYRPRTIGLQASFRF